MRISHIKNKEIQSFTDALPWLVEFFILFILKELDFFLYPHDQIYLLLAINLNP